MGSELKKRSQMAIPKLSASLDGSKFSVIRKVNERRTEERTGWVPVSNSF